MSKKVQSSLSAFGFGAKRSHSVSDDTASRPPGSSRAPDLSPSKVSSPQDNVPFETFPSSPELEGEASSDHEDTAEERTEEEQTEVSGLKSKEKSKATPLRSQKRSRTKRFQSSWQADPLFRGWLPVSADGSMVCRLCQDSKKENNFTRGCRDFQRSASLRHINPKHCANFIIMAPSQIIPQYYCVERPRKLMAIMEKSGLGFCTLVQRPLEITLLGSHFTLRHTGKDTLTRSVEA